MSSQDFYTVRRYSKRNYDDANLFITLDQWTKFIKVVRLLSAAVISRFPEDRKDTKVLSMPIHPKDKWSIYTIEKDKEANIIQVMKQTTANIFSDSKDIIPFNDELNKAILTYRKKIYEEINKLVLIDPITI